MKINDCVWAAGDVCSFEDEALKRRRRLSNWVIRRFLLENFNKLVVGERSSNRPSCWREYDWWR